MSTDARIRAEIRTVTNTMSRPGERGARIRRRINNLAADADTSTFPTLGVTTTPRPCPHGDPWCPCRDGDACNHEDLAAEQLLRWALDGYGAAA